MSASSQRSDPGLKAVVAWLGENARPDPNRLFGGAIRQSIDEVLDGPRTGRWDFATLEKTEKTYVGTKIEIVVRSALGLERGSKLDLEIEGHPVDLKWAMNSAWQIPREAVGQLCLCIGGRKSMTAFQVGVVRCDEAHLNPGENRDGKRTLSADGRAAMHHLVAAEPIPPNFVAEMDADIRAEVMEQDSIQARVATLFLRLPYTPIPRGAISTVAQTTGDPMRRVRADAHAEDPLRGMMILSARYGKAVLEALGQEPLKPNHFMSVPEKDIDALPRATRDRLDLG